MAQALQFKWGWIIWSTGHYRTGTVFTTPHFIHNLQTGTISWNATLCLTANDTKDKHPSLLVPFVGCK
jgi:hypothetical protein